MIELGNVDKANYLKAIGEELLVGWMLSVCMTGRRVCACKIRSTTRHATTPSPAARPCPQYSARPLAALTTPSYYNTLFSPTSTHDIKVVIRSR